MKPRLEPNESAELSAKGEKMYFPFDPTAHKIAPGHPDYDLKSEILFHLDNHKICVCGDPIKTEAVERTIKRVNVFLGESKT